MKPFSTRRPRFAALLVLGLTVGTLTACGARGDNRGYGSVAPPGFAIHVHAGHGWARKPTGELGVKSGGSWTWFKLPSPASSNASIAVTGSNVVVGTISQGRLVVDVSTDHGASWKVNPTQLSAPSDDGQVQLTMAPDGNSWLAGVASATSTGVAQTGDYAELGSNAGSLSQVFLPGDVSDTVWLSSTNVITSGGADHSRLFASTNGGTSWTDITEPVTGQEPPPAQVADSTPRFSVAGRVDDRTAAVVEEIHKPGGGSLAAKAVTTAGAASDLGAVPVPASAWGGGYVDLSAGPYGAGSVAALVPGGADLAVFSPSARPQTIALTGLPVGAAQVAFSGDQDGIADVTVSSCSDGKTGCSSVFGSYASSDGGQHWQFEQ